LDSAVPPLRGGTAPLRMTFSLVNCASVLEGETEFFDNRISQDFASHAPNFRFRFRTSQSTVKCELKVLTLANLFQALVAHFLQSAVDCLSLRIQNALLQRNINVSFHGGFLIIRQAASEAQRTSGLDQSGELRIQICQRVLQDLAVARVLGGFELLEHMLARQQEAFSLALGGNLGGSQWRRRWPGRRKCLSLLFLDRLALPSSRHLEIIPSQVMADGLFICKTAASHIRKSPMPSLVFPLSGRTERLLLPGDTRVPSWHQTCQSKK
jgi:hypothetical protein